MLRACVCTAVSLLLVGSAASAATRTYTWVGGSGNWDDASSWSSSDPLDLTGIPDDSDETAVIAPASIVTVVQDRDNLRLEALELGGPNPTIINDRDAAIFGSDPSYWAAGTLRGIGTFSIESFFFLTTGGPKLLLDGQTFTNEGPATLTGGGWLHIDSASSFRNLGTLDLQVDSRIAGDSSGFGAGGVGHFENAGLLRKSGGSLATDVDVVVENTGDIVVEAATLRFRDDFTHDPSTGSLSVQAPGVLEFSFLSQGGNLHTFGDGSVIEGDGPARFLGALVSIPGSLTVLAPSHFGQAVDLSIADTLTLTGDSTWEYVRMNGPGTVSTQGTVEVAGGGDSFLLNGVVLENEGTFIVTRPLSIDSTSRFRNLGTFEIHLVPISSTTLGAGGAGQFENEGIFRNLGNVTTTVAPLFENRGSVEVLAGQLSFAQPFVQTEGQLVLNGGSLATVSLNPVEIAGGTLAGSGAVSAPVSVHGAGVLSPGAAGAEAGQITVWQIAIGPGGALAVDVAGTSPGVDQDAVTSSGGITLGGALEVRVPPAAAIQPTDTFVVASAASPILGSFENAPSGSSFLTPQGHRFTVWYGSGSAFPATQLVLSDADLFEALTVVPVSGTPQGGTLTATVGGQVVTETSLPGEPIAVLLARLAAAVNSHPLLAPTGFRAVVEEETLLFNDPAASVTSGDPGLVVGANPVPSLTWHGAIVLLGSLLMAAGFAQARRRGPKSAATETG